LRENKEENMRGEELRKLREKKGLTREQLASRLQVSYMTLYRWEKGITRLHPVFEEKIKRILGRRRG